MISAVNFPSSRWEEVSPSSTIVSGRRPIMAISYLIGEESCMGNSTGKFPYPLENYTDGEGARTLLKPRARGRTGKVRS